MVRDTRTIELEGFDIKRIEEIAKLRGEYPDVENLTDAEVWGIVNDALIQLHVNLRHAPKETT